MLKQIALYLKEEIVNGLMKSTDIGEIQESQRDERSNETYIFQNDYNTIEVEKKVRLICTNLRN